MSALKQFCRAYALYPTGTNAHVKLFCDEKVVLKCAKIRVKVKRASNICICLYEVV